MTTGTRYNTIYQIQNILRDRSILEKVYNGIGSEYSKFLLSILKDKRYDLYARSEIASEELYKIVNKNEDEGDVLIMVNDKVALQDILLDCLKETIDEQKTYNWVVQEMYLKNLESILPNTRKIKITNSANNLIKLLIQKNPYEYFKKYFIRQHPEPSFKGQYYNFDPFVTYYFDDQKSSVISFLNSPSVSQLFQNNNEEKNFYNYIKNSFESVKTDKFLVEDRITIELLDKFIKEKKRHPTS